jgi:hypothetical protein
MGRLTGRGLTGLSTRRMCEVCHAPQDASNLRCGSRKFLGQRVICEDELPVEGPAAETEIVEGLLI